ncbi:hypothetical protein IID24_02775 [Patescibacteria group bacterium]|nr:hypothetical protein [Patescibacteria group bacterium]
MKRNSLRSLNAYVQAALMKSDVKGCGRGSWEIAKYLDSKLIFYKKQHNPNVPIGHFSLDEIFNTPEINYLAEVIKFGIKKGKA